VSTILKALKKLEQEKESQRRSGPIPVYSGSKPSAGGMGAWFRRSWIQSATVGMIILTLGLTALYFYLEYRDPGAPVREDRAGTSKKRATATLAGRSQSSGPISTPVEKKPPASDERRSIARPQPVPPVLPDQDASAGNPNSVPGQSSQLQRPGPQYAESDRVQGIPETDQTVPQPEPSPAKRAPSELYKSTPPLTDGRLKVHAIAWSSNSEDRMAVVNTRVVYEGDSVDGFLVVAIRQEDVVVREKEKGLWRVVFGRP